MAETARTPTPDTFVDILTRVVDRKETVLLHDQNGRAVAALVPIEDVEQTEQEASASTRRPRRKRGSPLRAEDLLAAARALIVEQADRLPPWEAIKADPQWQQRWDSLLASVRSNIPPETTPEEIEADIREACEEVRQERLARRS